MKFALKMILVVAALLALSLSFAGWLVIDSQFQGELDSAAENALTDTELFGLTLQALCLDESLREGETPAQGAARVLQNSPAPQNQAYLLLTAAGEPVASSGTVAALEEMPGTDRRVMAGFLTLGDRRYVSAAQWIPLFDEEFLLQRSAEITGLYQRAEDSLRLYRRVMLVILLLGIALTTAAALVLTAPIRRISRTSKQLSAGLYDRRVKVRSQDELGQLAADFNHMADALEGQIHQLEDAAQRQRDFTASFAHELKTPLTSVIGYADTIRSRDLDREQVSEAANYIFTEGRRLERMSFALLDLFALEREAPEMVPCSMAALGEEAAQSCSYLLEQSGVQLDLDLEDQRRRAAPELLKTLLYNLIDNARKASAPGSRVLLTGKAEGEAYVFTVTDRGRGIPAQALDRLTEPFYMVDKSRARAQGGAGLGLALCQRIARLHGGDLEFSSVEGEGTQVRLRLEGGGL